MYIFLQKRIFLLALSRMGSFVLNKRFYFLLLYSFLLYQFFSRLPKSCRNKEKPLQFRTVSSSYGKIEYISSYNLTSNPVPNFWRCIAQFCTSQPLAILLPRNHGRIHYSKKRRILSCSCFAKCERFRNKSSKLIDDIGVEIIAMHYGIVWGEDKEYSHKIFH